MIALLSDSFRIRVYVSVEILLLIRGLTFKLFIKALISQSFPSASGWAVRRRRKAYSSVFWRPPSKHIVSTSSVVFQWKIYTFQCSEISTCFLFLNLISDLHYYCWIVWVSVVNLATSVLYQLYYHRKYLPNTQCRSDTNIARIVRESLLQKEFL